MGARGRRTDPPPQHPFARGRRFIDAAGTSAVIASEKVERITAMAGSEQSWGSGRVLPEGATRGKSVQPWTTTQDVPRPSPTIYCGTTSTPGESTLSAGLGESAALAFAELPRMPVIGLTELPALGTLLLGLRDIGFGRYRIARERVTGGGGNTAARGSKQKR